MPTAKDCSAKKMCSLCPPRKKSLPKKMSGSIPSSTPSPFRIPIRLTKG
nr:unnamed protein product [Callosobruchus chinensis]